MLDLRDDAAPAAGIIEVLDLRPHPEGGHFRETFRDAPSDGARGASTAILFLLRAGEISHWHRVDADEIWLWQAGAPLELSVSDDGVTSGTHILGPESGFQHVVRRGEWQSAASRGAWTLVSCVVAPAFQFDGFELAPPGWTPG